MGPLRGQCDQPIIFRSLGWFHVLSRLEHFNDAPEDGSMSECTYSVHLYSASYAPKRTPCLLKQTQPVPDSATACKLSAMEASSGTVKGCVFMQCSEALALSTPLTLDLLSHCPTCCHIYLLQEIVVAESKEVEREALSVSSAEVLSHAKI